MLLAISLRARSVFHGKLSQRTPNFSKFLSKDYFIYREYKKLLFVKNSTVATGRNPICYEGETELASLNIFLYVLRYTAAICIIERTRFHDEQSSSVRTPP